eukprot:gene19001-25585_t
MYQGVSGVPGVKSFPGLIPRSEIARTRVAQARRSSSDAANQRETAIRAAAQTRLLLDLNTARAQRRGKQPTYVKKREVSESRCDAIARRQVGVAPSLRPPLLHRAHGLHRGRLPGLLCRAQHLGDLAGASAGDGPQNVNSSSSVPVDTHEPSRADATATPSTTSYVPAGYSRSIGSSSNASTSRPGTSTSNTPTSRPSTSTSTSNTPTSRPSATGSDPIRSAATRPGDDTLADGIPTSDRFIPRTSRARGSDRRQVSSQGTSRSQVADANGGISLFALIGVAGFAGVALLFFMYRQNFAKGVQESFKGTALSFSAAVEQKQLQKSAVARLNDFSDRFRNQPSVDLSALNLGEEGSAYVVEGLAFNLTCQAVDLSKNGIGKMGVGALCQVLQGCGVRTLMLGTNSIGDEGAELLATAISDLGQNGISDRGAKALAEALKLNTTITRLDLSGNAIDVEGATAIAEALVANSTLQSLRMRDKYAGETAIAEALAANSTLQSLSMSDNYVGEKGGVALGEALSKNSSITELYLKGNEMEDAGIAALCEGLQGRERDIKILDIGNNSITPLGADAVARMMQGKKSLKEINLYMNDVGDEGMPKELTTLDLGGNNIGPVGAKVLAEALRGHKELRSLELGYNPLGPSGTKTIVDISKFDLKLDALRLGWCKIHPKGSHHISNLNLDALRLGWCKINPEGSHHISDLLMFNATISTLDALKNNPECAPKEMKLNSNYITRFGQVALSDAVDMVFENGRGKHVSIIF